ncbi:hypothetical protein [Actinotalea sp. C106]|uniref:hypothetical protein n=1 Tax=Actinotalea sp. C106 TaxID=2908644 RepID=UPI0020286D35|nr:hypothetical protein [Actinotalea sp. C106]
MPEPDALLDSAPLLRELRERHPDVDVVVLPAEAPRGPARAPVPQATLDAEAQHVTSTVEDLLAALGEHPGAQESDDAEGNQPEVRTRWRTAPGQPDSTSAGVVTPVAEARVAVPDVLAATKAANILAGRMAERGWQGALRTTGTTAQFDAAQDGRTLRVVRLEGTVLVTATGRGLTVTKSLARELVTRAEVAR